MNTCCRTKASTFKLRWFVHLVQLFHCVSLYTAWSTQTKIQDVFINFMSQ